MRLRVELLPQGPYRDVVILIDVLRTSTMAPLLFDKGITHLYLCPSLRVSRAVARQHGHLLLGERGGLPPEGFNYGNSPAELARASLDRRGAVLTSENAPRTLPALSGAKHLLLGSLYNADAVVKRALELAKDEVAMVCSGFAGHEDLDDTLSAGFLAARLKQSLPEATLEGAAALAISLLKAFPDPLEALWQSRSGHYLRKLGLTEDIAIASLVSTSTKVPELAERIEEEDTSLFCFQTNVT
ncbi:MAG: 2-phosphosulfolactate phosphatase [Deinococcota bacterium]|nr:2-phosphosulfolactate phosphatase [Deinococcota bacterium]